MLSQSIYICVSSVYSKILRVATEHISDSLIALEMLLDYRSRFALFHYITEHSERRKNDCNYSLNQANKGKNYAPCGWGIT